MYSSSEGEAVIRILNSRSIDHSTIGETPRILIGNIKITTSLNSTSRIRSSSSDVYFKNIITTGSGNGNHIQDSGSNLTTVGWISTGTGTVFNSPTSTSFGYKPRSIFLDVVIERARTEMVFLADKEYH